MVDRGRQVDETAELRSVGRVVIKIGSSSVTTEDGEVDTGTISELSSQIAELLERGTEVVVVTSGAIAAGLSALGRRADRPSDPAVLQAVSAVGQHRLMRTWQEGLAPHGILAGQVLLAPLDFTNRGQYLHARGTLAELLKLGVVPVVDENDAVADEEIRFGDNDRLGALVAHLVGADLFVILTDTAGLLSGDPRFSSETTLTLIEEVVEIDHELERIAGGPGTPEGSGGMLSKLAAAKIATWSGVETVIADARRPGVVAAAVARSRGVGTVLKARRARLPARKLWIAFALRASGTVVVDEGARRALVNDGRSLLPAGVVKVQGEFVADDAVEIAGTDGTTFAKGLVRMASARAAEWVGSRSGDLPEELSGAVVHRDDLVILR